jgi:hypothetical protein
MGLFDKIKDFGGDIVHVGSDIGTSTGHLAAATGHLVTGDTSGALSRFHSGTRDLKSSISTTGKLAGTVGKGAFEATGVGYGIDYGLGKLGAGDYAPGTFIASMGSQIGEDASGLVDAPEGFVKSGVDLAHGDYKKAALEGLLAGASVISIAQDMTPTGLIVNTALERTPAGQALLNQIVSHVVGNKSYVSDPKTGGKIPIDVGKDKDGNPVYTWEMSENDLEEARRKTLLNRIIVIIIVAIVLSLLILLL